MTKKTTLILIFSVSAILICLIAYKYISDSVPTLGKINELKIISLSDKLLELTIKLEVKNNSILTQNMQSGYFNLIVDDVKIGSAKIIQPVLLQSNSLGEARLLVTFETLELSKLLSRNNNISMSLNGNIVLRNFGIDFSRKLTMPFSLDLKGNLKKGLESDANSKKILKIGRTTVNSLSLDSTNVTTNFVLTNPYQISFKLVSYPCDIFLNGEFAGHGNMSEPIEIPKSSDPKNGQFIFTLKNLNVVRIGFKSLMRLSTKIDYEAKGIITINILGLDISFPFIYKGDLIENVESN